MAALDLALAQTGCAGRMPKLLAALEPGARAHYAKSCGELKEDEEDSIRARNPRERVSIHVSCGAWGQKKGEKLLR